MNNLMRRKDREITDFSSMKEILQSCDCCRLGLLDGNEAYIVPMNFGYDLADNQITLYFHCAKEGRKISLISKQKTVSFEMDSKHVLMTGEKACDFSYNYSCIMGIGTVDIVSSESEKICGLQKIMQHYTENANWNFDARYLNMTHVLKLSVEKWSCKEH